MQCIRCSVPFKWRYRVCTRARMSSYTYPMFGTVPFLLALLLLCTFANEIRTQYHIKAKSMGRCIFIISLRTTTTTTTSCLAFSFGLFLHSLLIGASGSSHCRDSCTAGTERGREVGSATTACVLCLVSVSSQHSLFRLQRSTTNFSIFLYFFRFFTSFSLDGFHFNLGAIRALCLAVHFMHISVEVKRISADTDSGPAFAPKPKWKRRNERVTN